MAPGSARATAAAAILMTVASGVTAQERGFDFALVGDMPYTKVQEVEYQRVLTALNAADLKFVAHIGDFQFDAALYHRNPAIASMPCVDENYKAIYDSFQTVRHPFILTPGDNDWSDCWPLEARKVDPLDLLAKIRTMFFPEGRRPRAEADRRALISPRIPISPSSARTCAGPSGVVTFVTVHIVGENDNFGRTPEMDAEQAERKVANIDWLKQAFAEAKAADSRGVVILTQANPGFRLTPV